MKKVILAMLESIGVNVAAPYIFSWVLEKMKKQKVSRVILRDVIFPFVKQVREDYPEVCEEI